MSTINVFQISFEIWGCIIGIIVCILLGATSQEAKDPIGKKLWSMILMNNLLLVSDALAYIYRGDLSSLGIVMTRISNFSLFALEDLLLVTFIRYVKSITGCNEEKASKWWEYLSYGLLAAAFTGLLLTQLNGLYYSFDDTNHYQRGSGIWMNFAATGAVFLICVLRLLLRRKELSKSEASTFLLCVVVFLLCIAVQFLFYGLSLINIGTTISILMMYLSHYKAQYDAYIASSIEEAIRDTEALRAWKSASNGAEQERESAYEKHKE